MKILIADDIADLVEVMGLMVQGIYPWAEILLAYDGAQAIDMIDKNPDLTLVLCDYSMPQKSGGQVYHHLRQKNQNIPFILVSTFRPEEKAEFAGAHLIAQLDKPFTDESVAAVLRKFEPLTLPAADAQNKAKETLYVPIHVGSLKKIGHVEMPLFLKLSDSNFVKILNSGATFGREEYERFLKKNISHLWIEISSYERFILNYKKKIISREAFRDCDATDASSNLALDHQVILAAGKSFGWSKETIDLAVVNIKQVTNLLEKHPDLKAVAERLKKEQQSRLSTQSILLAIAGTAILAEIGWNSELARQKITFAALLHDMELSEDLFTTMVTILNESELSDFKDDSHLKEILEHPLKTAEMLANWPLCPPDVDVIVRQHHERPDGKGFPFGLDAHRIFPLAALIIIAEDMIIHSIDNFGDDAKTYLLSKRELYSRGEFKSIYEAALRSLK